MTSKSLSWKALLKNWEFKVAAFIGIYFLISHVVLETTDVVNEKGLKSHLKVLPEEVIDYYGKQPFSNVDKYAYMQYATNYDYLNLAIINFIHLRKANTKILTWLLFMMKSYITMLVINGVSCTKWQTNTKSP